MLNKLDSPEDIFPIVDIGAATCFLTSNVAFATESVAVVSDTAPALTNTLTLFKSACNAWLAVPDTVIVIVFDDESPNAV
ncbi:Uncharacterised protein [Clostridioides difficile]|nr:Uncharacterised protein [Clostridioides difficile]